MDLNILTMDLRWIRLVDTYPCPALLPFLHGVKSDDFDSVRAITLLRPEDFQRYDMPFGHRAQLVHHAKETSGVN